jgi:ubiquinone/menaquinone biosynthesis C-methylase UbiE
VILKEVYERAEIHDDWEAVYRANPLQDHLNERMLERTLAYLQPAPQALFLDAGCGVGYHSLAIARRGFRCIGVDISETILERARRNGSRAGLDDHVSFHAENLEDLSFADGHFDFVHCRGVLMHVPQWERALEQLCRVLKPGGRLVILEANTTALETWLVRFIRLLRRGRSEVVRTPGGFEFWAEKDGQPCVTRIARIGYLQERLRANRVTPLRRFASEFWDINRFAPGFRRNLAIRFNRWWFRWRLPAGLSMGNAVIGEKAT